MVVDPFSPLLIEGRSQQTSTFAAFSPGWLSTEPREKENVRNVVAHLPCAADLAGHIQARGSSLVLAGTVLITTLLVGLNEDVQDLQMDLVMSMI